MTTEEKNEREAFAKYTQAQLVDLVMTLKQKLREEKRAREMAFEDGVARGRQLDTLDEIE